MKPGYTDITLVLDRSGSMKSIRDDTIGGVNTFIEGQKNVPGEARFSLYQFDDQYEEVSKGVPIREVKLLTERTFIPRGGTCLYGAVGLAIQNTGERFKAMAEHDRPEKVIFVIVTDGMENESPRHEWSQGHTAESVKNAIEHQTNAYKWEFVYIGINAIASAATIGITADKALNYSTNSKGTEELYGSLGSNVRSFRVNSKVDMSWEEKQRKAQADAR